MTNRYSDSKWTRALLAAALLAAIHLGHAQQSGTPAANGAQNHANEAGAATHGDHGAESAEKKGGGDLDVKNVFRNVCSFCHQDYGRKAGKGPQLMDSPKTDQELFDRIKHGKPGRMAAFGAQFSDDQIRQIVEFIRELEPDSVPST
jgi:mono/diheme cytochrome c family protein